jgi:TetR/AcrR family tetracycline transcriptional repressor
MTDETRDRPSSADDGSGQPPAWWTVDRRAARAEERQARRRERATRRDGRHKGRGDQPAREPLTPERIADAALAIIDAQGVDGLTVRALAQALGVGTMTLYWYVRDKDEVLDLVADRLLAGVILPPASLNWRAAVREGAFAVRAALLRHARAVPVVAWRGSFGPNGLQLVEGSIAAFRAAGFGPQDAADAYFTVSNFVTGFCVFEASAAGGLGLTRPTSTGRASQYVALLPPERFPNLLAAAPRMFGGDRDERFAFGLECVIVGIASRLATGSTGNAAGDGEAD